MKLVTENVCHLVDIDNNPIDPFDFTRGLLVRDIDDSSSMGIITSIRSCVTVSVLWSKLSL